MKNIGILLICKETKAHAYLFAAVAITASGFILATRTCV
jgi:hypothetical protein